MPVYQFDFQSWMTSNAQPAGMNLLTHYDHLRRSSVFFLIAVLASALGRLAAGAFLARVSRVGFFVLLLRRFGASSAEAPPRDRLGDSFLLDTALDDGLGGRPRLGALPRLRLRPASRPPAPAGAAATVSLLDGVSVAAAATAAVSVIGFRFRRPPARAVGLGRRRRRDDLASGSARAAS